MLDGMVWGRTCVSAEDEGLLHDEVLYDADGETQQPRVLFGWRGMGGKDIALREGGGRRDKGW